MSSHDHDPGPDHKPRRNIALVCKVTLYVSDVLQRFWQEKKANSTKVG